MKNHQLLDKGKTPLNFLFRLLHKTKTIYLILIFLISIGISGWTVEAYFVRIPIFGFHNIVDMQNPADLPPRRRSFPTDYSKQNLAIFLEYLVQQNYWFLSSQDLYTYFINKSKPVPPEHQGQKPIMITFDDGYKGVHTNALPIIEKLSFIYKEKGKFVLFVNPHFLGVDMGKAFLPHTTCNDLREGYKKGFYDIQSHGFTHKNLTTLSGKKLEFEIAKSKSVLRKCMINLDKNKLVGAHIAYPYGASDWEVESILPKYHLSGFLYDNNLLRVSRLRNNYRISRMTVNKDMLPTYLIRIAERSSTLRKKRWF
ncbi:MAG: polysaccharide deacetylase family protein [Tychonema bourrellyi B0820]|uniref:Polysaccharide deacetylase n=1 Tax=Tychonema bourrellyi FEM_GT703 TaxID=2040638 RepID=A0A2G4F2M1_9CYAN|nr:polysaccharide deacetylase family protein [Tychonema bourrellyi]MDQ2099398.1 polysaccharide deacetylase family protein [Tychonema bourrellyi B0820]PHX56011.1 polysaccharide deacetylase [Tychonema bourrellyi FEM_GT703]